ncbi:glycosyl transferase [Antrihabitans sp. NCIMB 15449]|jgi:hypothetical protein|uniref:Glycosyl transferase n=1 Tax=Antrihabitans spumae TaxID=3373370 RepID=A0ABW7JJQ2_9NOCA
MPVLTTTAEPILERRSGSAPDGTKRRWVERLRDNWSRTDSAVALAFLGLAVFVLNHQWRNLGNGYLSKSGQDQTMWEWFFAVAAHSLSNFESPLSTDLQNFPLGVNMMANTAMFGVSIPLAPVTLMFGPTVTYVLALTVGLFGTALAWYWVFSRHLVESRTAAAIGGLFCGFAPSMISHANAHPNFVCLFILPLLVLQMIRLTHSGKWIRDGIVLGLMVTLQIGLGEEPLLIFAIAFGIFAAVYYFQRRDEFMPAVRNARKAFGLAVAISVAITAIPLWWQFFGPQSYHLLSHDKTGNDSLSLFQFPSQSIGGILWPPGQDVAINPTEENAYFGWPLLAFVGFASIWLWRNRIARTASITMAGVLILSMGPEITVGWVGTGIPMPWHLIGKLPLFESLLETRFAMAALPLIGILLALGTERAMRHRASSVPWLVGLAVALLPLTPTPLPVVERPATPEFFADGTWQNYAGDGSIVTVPLPKAQDAAALRWQSESDFGFAVPGGYFLGPGTDDKTGIYGPVERPTARLLSQVQKTGRVPIIDDKTRAAAIADLRFWHAEILVLPEEKNQEALKATVTQILGDPGRQVDDVWLWDVRFRADVQPDPRT